MVGPEGHHRLGGRWRAHRRRSRKTCSDKTDSELAVREVRRETSMAQKRGRPKFRPRSLVDGGAEVITAAQHERRSSEAVQRSGTHAAAPTLLAGSEGYLSLLESLEGMLPE
jgi:hypothetical protein